MCGVGVCSLSHGQPVCVGIVGQDQRGPVCLCRLLRQTLHTAETLADAVLLGNIFEGGGGTSEMEDSPSPNPMTNTVHNRSLTTALLSDHTVLYTAMEDSPEQSVPPLG